MRVTLDDRTTGEAHGRADHAYEWVTTPGTDPDDLLTRVEAATGLSLASRSPGAAVDGYLTTFVAPAGVYARLVLYGGDCDGTACTHGPHPPHRAGKPLSKAALGRLGTAAREATGHVLGGGDDLTVLARLDPELGYAEAERSRARRGAVPP